MAKGSSKNGSEKSARNVLEQYAEGIRKQAEKDAANHGSSLKGELKKAKFYPPLFVSLGVPITVPSDPCSLDFAYHSNTPGNRRENRGPCVGREQKRFSYEVKAECDNDKIRGNKAKYGSCAPYRRRHMCDYNLEHINEGNTRNSHDLLGNILVTAKYEGESLSNYMKNHIPSTYNSGICTVLARTFADIGDIVRGKDMFKSNDNIEKGLKNIFKKIHGNLKGEAPNYYKEDKDGNHYKLREDWWYANRNEVWRAITCSTTKDANYFRKNSHGTDVFTSDGYCGRNEGKVPTNLDYVPQFLRWFDEWSEDFCRTRKRKLGNVKNECRGDEEKGEHKYCSGDGHDCTNTDLSHNNIFVDLNCPGCEGECSKYKEWIDKREEEFHKQKYKYEKEIEKLKDASNNNYDKAFYKNFLKDHRSLDSFLETLKEGPYCNMNAVDGKIDFNKPLETFSPSIYCKTCPLYGVNCKTRSGECIHNNENGNKGKNDLEGIDVIDTSPTSIDMQMIDRRLQYMEDNLKRFFKKSCLLKSVRDQKWTCQISKKMDVCNLEKFNKDIDPDNNITFKVLLDRWLKDFLEGYYNSKSKIELCTNEKENKCIKGCTSNCVCVEEWIKKKENEWNQIKKHFNKQDRGDGYDIAYKVILYFEKNESDVNKCIDDFKSLKNQVEYEDCNADDNCRRNNNKKKKNMVNILLKRLTEKINKCKTKHDETNGNECCDVLPIDDEDEPPPTLTPIPCEPLPRTPCAGNTIPTTRVTQVCEKVKQYITQNQEKTGNNRCKDKVAADWNCNDTSIVSGKGECMPPRRQKLCIYYLANPTQITNITTQEQLKDAFIKCASVESYLSWQKYKIDHSGKNGVTDPQTQLKTGEIPSKFLRSMFYTYSDYKDLCLGKDIGTHQNTKNISVTVKSILEKQKGKSNGPKKPEDWWNENAKAIWDGMVCSLIHAGGKKEKLNTKYSIDKVKFSDKTTTSLCDFSSIPQFLRWMMEWSEDFCRKQKVEYGKLKMECHKCKHNPSSQQCKNDCKECKQKCKEYNDFIIKWKPQWQKIEERYENLYQKAIKNGSTTTYVDTNDQNMVTYLKSFTSDTKYSTAGGYITQKGYISDCVKQKEFTNSGNNYAFEQYPNDYKDKCTCQDPPKSICEIVEGTLKGNDGKTPINGCGSKTKDDYPGWNCTDSSLVSGDGECMPPRRQKFCTSLLAKVGIFNEKEDIRTAFVTSAAIETYFAWKKYKKNNKEAEEELNKGKIPEGFKRQMLYTFADYKDIFFGTDISKNKYIPEVTTNVKNVLKQEKHEQWWNVHAHEIWEGMVCAITDEISDRSTKTKIQNDYKYDKLKNSGDEIEKFAKTPQFLRWFTEWGEDYCKEYTKELGTLDEGCKDYRCDMNGTEKGKCEKACKDYKEWIKIWKTQYEKQRKKFDTDKSSTLKNLYSNMEHTEAYQFLHENSLNGTCSCMKDPSKEKNLPLSLDENQQIIKDKCHCQSAETEELDSSLNCVDKSAFELKEQAEKGIKGVEKTLKVTNSNDVYKEKTDVKNDEPICEIINYTSSTGQNNECKDNGNPFDVEKEIWDCNKETNNVDNQDICLPPRRKHMCTKLLEKLEATTTLEELFKNVLRTAANEGKHLNDTWNKAENPKKKITQICDAMKHSFADLGDIIRGRDNYRSTNGNNNNVEEKLKTVFQNIQKTYALLKQKYPDNTSDLHELRSAWWDANRESIWKAMTCHAPRDANILKLIKQQDNNSNNASYSEVQYYCGHQHPPPVDDYIPQPFRWIKEWTQAYCTAKYNELSTFPDCVHCTKNNEKCEQKVHGACKKCKTQCEEYSQFIDKWKKQYDVLEKAYEEIYKNATTNIGTSSGIDQNTKMFVTKLKKICNDPKTSGEYLDRGKFCKKFKFSTTSKQDADFAFKTPANLYKVNCECANNFEEVDQCPVVENECTKYNHVVCKRKRSIKDIEEWNTSFLRNPSGINDGVLVPPRRKDICFGNMNKPYAKIKNKDDFKKKLLDVASTEAKKLSEKYDRDYNRLLTAMKYSFADIGNIVKGDDMLDNLGSLHNRLNELFNPNGSRKLTDNRRIWWDQKKDKIWNVMMCQYNGTDKKNDSCPSHDHIDEIPQYLRWISEWGKIFCKEKVDELKGIIEQCKKDVSINNYSNIENIPNGSCKQLSDKYYNWLNNRTVEWINLSEKYKKDTGGPPNYNGWPSSADAYVKLTCPECDCTFEELKTLYDKHENERDFVKSYIEKTITKHSHKKEDASNSKKHKEEDKKSPEPAPGAPEQDSGKVPLPSPKPVPKPDVTPLPNDQPINTNIWTSNIPLGVIVAVTSLAFLFLKRKTKTSPVDLFRILDIPQNEFDIPTTKSSNRYVPYKSGHYAGKTYIYMEGDESDNYIGDISSSDITSSESDVEEIDVNNIYPYRSPKHKTLIDVVLEPTKRHGNGVDKPKDDIYTNKLTEEQWNQLKQEFISNTNQNDQMDIFRSNISGTPPTNTQHDPTYVSQNIYSGIDLINDSLSGNNIYDEVLKRKENELFGTNHPKHHTTNSDPILNQLDLVDQWLDKNRYICETFSNKEELLDKLKELWDNKNNNSGITDISQNNMFNSNISLQTDTDPKPKNQFTYVDTILDDKSVDHNKIHIEVDANNKTNGSLEKQYPISDIWNI